ncbi:MAG: zinc-binding alcohol dehydrogenase family protein [Phycisphaera sp.]|nr:zinc-binding alcohol dehydrogenase family protein [Phycisphaera sp.]
MKAMIMRGNAPIRDAPLELREMPDPQPGPGEVRVKVHACAICRTDLHVIEGDLPPVRDEVIPGHQVVGVVDALGEGCASLRVGDRVGIAWLRGACGTCKYCTADNENLCADTRFTGYHEHGGYATHAVVAEAFAYRIPDTFDDVAATPLLCAGIIGYRSLSRANPRPGCRLGLVGFGSSAHIVMQLAKHRGYTVDVATRGAGHRQLAREMGAGWVGEDPADFPDKLDSAIIFAPAGELIPATLAALDKGGTLACAGIYMTDCPTLDYERHLFYERDLRSVTCNTRDDGRALLAEAAAIPIRPHTTTYPLADANRALLDLKNDAINGTGVLLMDGLG